MAITFIEKRKRLKYLFPVLVIVILVTAFVWWQSFFTEKKPVLPPPPIKVVPIKKVEINYEILKHSFLEKFQSFEQIPLFEGKAERENPFMPY